MNLELPFTAAQFDAVFRSYNMAVWPAQWLLLALALAAWMTALRPRPWSSVAVSAVLAALWVWMALAYHLAFFASISPAAVGFAALSLAGAGVFIWQGMVRRRLVFGRVGGWRAVAGLALVVFALVMYPLWSANAGHPYPTMPTFGLPCPTTLFTVGLLCFAERPTPRSPLLMPLLWCVVGAQAAFLLQVKPDLGLIAAGMVGAALWVNAQPQKRSLKP